MRGNLTRLLTIAVLCTFAFAACGQGCLKCDLNDNCLLCDFVSNFVSSGNGACVPKKADKCTLLAPTGECITCAQGFYYDGVSDACLQVPAANLIPKCDYYASISACQTCAQGFFLEDGQCLPALYPIRDCSLYLSATSCAQCSAGSVLHPSKNRCVAVSGQNCLFQNNLRCDACAEGYALDLNYYVAGAFQPNSVNVAANMLFNAVVSGQSYSNVATPCRPLTIANCAEYASFTVCKRCADKHFLAQQGAVCNAYPHPALPNCARYTYYNSCAQCNQGFLLAGTSDCLPVKPIDNCSKYSTTSAANICVECVDGYFVNGNTCNQRRKTVANCDVYDSDSDTCGTCAKSFVLTSDALACLPEILNCNIYQSSNINTANLACQQCADKFAYNNATATCDAGTVTDCRVYQLNSPTICQTCSQGFYLTNNTCVAHTEVKRCATYSAVVANMCTACDNKSFLNTQDIGCGPITNDIPQCVEYSSPISCKTCAQRYAASNGMCQLIPATEHCLSKNPSQQCTLCESGYLLSNGICVAPLDIETSQCDVIQNDGLASTFTCAKCAKNAVPFNYKDSYVCLKNSSVGFTTIPNCVKYINNAGVPTCVGCASGYYVSDGNVCVATTTTAANTTVVINYSDNTTPVSGGYQVANYSFDRYMVVPANLQSCKQAVYTNKTDANGYIKQCLACKTGFVPVVNAGNYKSHIDPNASNPSTFVPNLGYGFNTYACVQAVSPVYYPGATSTIPANCDSFAVVSSNVFCKACKRGFTGSIGNSSGNYFQNCDTPVTDCNVGVTYGGLIFGSANTNMQTDLMVNLSCHACYSPNKIPVVFLSAAGAITPFGLNNSIIIPSAETAKTDVSVQCLEISAASFKYRAEQYVAKPVENCGAARYNVDIAKQFTSYSSFATTPIVCAACKPGFAPIMANGMIVRCDAIAHCNTSSTAQWFNNCGACQLGYTWLFDTQAGKIDFSRCVPTTDRNCIATATNNTSLTGLSAGLPNGSCYMCAPGYSFNADNVCEAIDAPLCNPGRFVKSKYAYSLAMTNVDMLNVFNKNGNGCHICQSGYTSVKNSTDLFACTQSSYIMASDFPEDTAYVPNCKHYSNSGLNVVCSECTEGYIPSSDGFYCVDQDVYPSCERVNSAGTQCAVCQSGYVLVNEFCEKPTIQQCETYDAGLSFQSCLNCIDGYKLVSNKCVEGQVDNCRNYNNNETCLTCFDGYMLVSLANNNQACVLINDELNCEQVYTTQLNNSQNIQCAKCNAGFAPTNIATAFAPYVCQLITTVENCESYDINSTPIASSFDCVQCKEGYYLRDNICVARLVHTPNCSSYSQVDDLCAECASGFYLSNERTCDSFPTGIFGCVNYSDEQTCKACDKDMYLSGSSCNYVTVSIDQCAYYKDNSTCAQCEFNYFLKDNVCVEAKALNCASYSRIDRCASCLPGFGLQQSAATGTVDCVYIPDLNCRISENVFPFFCRECSSLFYNDHGRCMAVEQAIDFCDVYDSPTTCKRCSPTHILALDNKHCISGEEAGIKPYNQCIDNKLTRRPACNVCNAGQRFDNRDGKCIACANNTKENGCMFCNGDNDSSCVLCMPGFYMNKDGKCFANSAAPSGIIGDSWSR